MAKVALQTRASDEALRKLATDEAVREKARAAFDEVTNAGQGLDVLERCKRLNEFLRKDHGGAASKADLQQILDMLTAKPSAAARSRPACLDQPSPLLSGPAKPQGGKARSLADSAALPPKLTSTLADGEALQLLAVLEEAEHHPGDHSQRRSTLGGGSAAPSVGGSDSSSRPCSGLDSERGTPSSVSSGRARHPDGADEDDDLVSLLNPGAAARGAPASATAASAPLQQQASAAAERAREQGASKVRELQQRMRDAASAPPAAQSTSAKDGGPKIDLTLGLLSPSTPKGAINSSSSAAQQPAATISCPAAQPQPAEDAHGEAQANQRAAAEQQAAAEAEKQRRAKEELARRVAEEAERRTALMLAAAAEARRQAEEAAARKRQQEQEAALARRRQLEEEQQQRAAKAKAEQEAAAAALQRRRCAAALAIQRCWRGWVARRAAREAREALARRREQAAVALQAAARALACRRLLAALQAAEVLKRAWAARRIQRAWRVWHSTRGWQLGELRVPQRLSSKASGDGRASGQQHQHQARRHTADGEQLQPVRVRSTADKRLAPDQMAAAADPGAAVGGSPPAQHTQQAPAGLRRALSAARERSEAVGLKEEAKRRELGERVIMTGSQHRTTAQAIAIATNRAVPLPPRASVR